MGQALVAISLEQQPSITFIGLKCRSIDSVILVNFYRIPDFVDAPRSEARAMEPVQGNRDKAKCR